MDKLRQGNKEHGEEVQSTCTEICQNQNGGLSCSKIVLVDVFLEKKPQEIHRVYGIIDDQSNASMITPDLVDKMRIDGPREKYFLSTCSGQKEVKFGRRVPGVMVRSTSGRITKLPQLIEYPHIPQDKREIPTPEIARRFPHLQEIAEEIPSFDVNAGVHILIGRDAPELLKVRAFKNGPRGAPWAQKLDLG